MNVETCDVDLLKAYRKRSKKSWNDRAYKANDHVGRTRSMSYKEAKKDIEKRHPGECHKGYRERLLAQTYAVAIRIAVAITKASQEKKKKYIAAGLAWSVECQVGKESGGPDLCAPAAM